MSAAVIEAARARLEREHREASQRLRAIEAPYQCKRGPLGLLPDYVRAMPERRQAAAACDRALRALRAFNTQYPPARRATFSNR